MKIDTMPFPVNMVYTTNSPLKEDCSAPASTESNFRARFGEVITTGKVLHRTTQGLYPHLLQNAAFSINMVNMPTEAKGKAKVDSRDDLSLEFRAKEHTSARTMKEIDDSVLIQGH